jgi:hypothetical protein
VSDKPTKRIAVISPDGQFGTIDVEHAEAVTKAGGRVLTRAEVADRELQAEYASKSTLEKIGGVAANAGPAGWIAGKAYTAATGKHLELPPEAEAYKAGLDKSTIVLPHLQKAFEGAVGGDAGAKAFVDRQDKLSEAHPTLEGLGEAAGTVATTVMSGGLGAAGKLGTAAKLASPVSSAIGAAGNLAERGVASAIGSAASRGVLARAGVAAAEMGARGAVEGALYAGAQHASEELLHDRDLAADKLFAAAGTGALYGGIGGAALGGASSLASSGMGAARDRVAGFLARRGERAAEGAMATAPGAASKRMANELAFDALGATKTQSRSALENVAGGADAVGEYVNRVGIAPASEKSGFIGGALKAGAAGRADELLAAIQADKAGRIAAGFKETVGTTGARVDMSGLMDHVSAVYGDMRKDPTRVAGADTFLSRIKQEMGALKESGRVDLATGTMDASDAFHLRSDLAKQAYEMSKTSGAAGDAYKGFLREFDRRTIDAIDQAAATAGKSGLGDEIRHWKREWQLASAAEEAALGGAERMTRNNMFGIRESIGAAVGLATGSPLGALGTMVGGKLLRERGSAVGAYVMSQVSERAALGKWVQRIDDQIGKASKGLLQPAQKGLVKASDQMPPSKGLASTAIARVAAFKADPESHIERATRQVESIASHDPELADALVQRHVQAMSFLASKVPVTPDPDPLDPHPAPKMTPNEQAEFGRYAWYTEKPARFFAEVARGKITFEGAETAKALMPKAFAQLQDQTMEHLATMMSKGTQIPYRQRQYLGVLLDMAATPSQRPDHAAFLQANVSQNEQPPPPPKKSLMNAPKSHMSALDRLESGGPGRR